MKFIPNSVWQAFERELEQRNRELRRAQERIDRLTECLAQFGNLRLTMPQASEEEKQLAARGFGVTQQQPLERSEGWYDTKPFPIPKTSATGGTSQ